MSMHLDYNFKLMTTPFDNFDKSTRLPLLYAILRRASNKRLDLHYYICPSELVLDIIASQRQQPHVGLQYSLTDSRLEAFVALASNTNTSKLCIISIIIGFNKRLWNRFRTAEQV